MTGVFDYVKQGAAAEPGPNNNERLTAAFCYGSLPVLPFVIPLIVLVSRTRTRFQHYHAVQSLAFAGSMTLLWVAMLLAAGVLGSTIPIIGWLGSILLMGLMPITWMIAVAVALWAAWQAWRGHNVSIPLLTKFLNNQRERNDSVVAGAQRLRDGAARVMGSTVSVASQLLTGSQALLASSLSTDLNNLIQAMVQGSASIYDKAMDANYLDPLLQPDMAGSYHRLFDGGHTIAGAFRAARDAAPDDNIIQEALGAVQGLLRDGTTPRGLPLANWDKGTFDNVSGSLESTFGIPKSWFYDLNTYDAAELSSSIVGVVALIFAWNRADTEAFAKMVGSMGLIAVMSANPLLLMVTIVALARSLQKARQTGEYAEFVDGQLKGGIGAGATLGAVSLVGAATGSAGLILLVGIVTAVLVNQVTKDLSIVDIGRVVAKHARAAAKEIQVTVQRQGVGSVDSLSDFQT